MLSLCVFSVYAVFLCRQQLNMCFTVIFIIFCLEIVLFLHVILCQTSQAPDKMGCLLCC